MSPRVTGRPSSPHDEHPSRGVERYMHSCRAENAALIPVGFSEYDAPSTWKRVLTTDAFKEDVVVNGSFATCVIDSTSRAP